VCVSKLKKKNKITKSEHPTFFFFFFFFKLIQSFIKLLFQAWSFSPSNQGELQEHKKIKRNRDEHLNMGICKVHIHLDEWPRKSQPFVTTLVILYHVLECFFSV